MASSTLPVTMLGSIHGTHLSLAASAQITISPGFRPCQNRCLFYITLPTMLPRTTFHRATYGLDGRSRRDPLSSDTIREELCNYDQSAPTPANIFDNYKLRGNLLSCLSLFEYCMIVSTKRRQDATTEDVPSVHRNVPATTVPDLGDFNLEFVDEVLVPILTDSAPLPDLLQYRLRVDQNPTGASIASLMCEMVPLNKKQRIVVEKVLAEALLYANYPYDPSQRTQTLLYVGGEGGVDKS
ncbi:uncharacterized protein N7498_008932 [Penicillium cinerascens]|uniref:Uncharacterized protein n=1 Tax=Penicillium cinerascens TaxID=70096 RepID=A0A9W9JEF9_9EURO|nr:uncharacterized protein N7498_008932 [Penicillium cinerascens]KAJ5195494.1 hypothetical protein N7498_008932 [Penicillium cinerascens]